MTERNKLIIAVIGYIIDFISPLIGFLYGLILFFTNKEDEYYNKHSKYIMILAIILWIIDMIIKLYLGPVIIGG